ncbi:MAG: hypothetical protein ACQRW7_12180 [Caulobacterales bacterium]|uniref:hypothetical protein n=1 Tax=Glycocaulis sp. TaxID=1969725 RepID=UPI003FA0066C
MKPVLLAASLVVAACLAACEPAAEPVSGDDLQEPVASEDALSFFNDRFAGRWGMSEACEAEGLFTLTAGSWNLYERSCEVLELGRDGEMSFARVSCTAEGEREPDKTLTLRATGPDEITVEDGHYDWVRYRCQ